MKIIIQCIECYKEFETREYLVNVKKRKFCTQSCYYKNKIGRKIGRRTVFSYIKCHICGKIFERSNRWIKEKNFCSKKCTGRHNKVLMSGSNNWNWKGGKPKDKRSANTEEYQAWRKSVFERDNYTCQREDCDSKRGIYLHCHHIKSWAKFPELRYEVSNGLTLCVDCHLKKGLHRK